MESILPGARPAEESRGAAGGPPRRGARSPICEGNLVGRCASMQRMLRSLPFGERGNLGRSAVLQG